MNLIIDALAMLASWCAPAVLVVAAAILLVESGLLVGFLLPGTGTVLAVGALVGLGELDPVVTSIILIASSTAGAQLAFRSIRRGSCRADIAGSNRFARLINGVLARARRLFSGDASVGTVTTHFVGGARTLGPRLAAGSSLSFPRFAVLNIAAATVWVTLLVTTGSVLGANPAWIPWVTCAFVVAAVGLITIRALRRSDATVPDSTIPAPSI
ncbi:hypothetical protein BH93_27145 (plasmid) [Rhodococcoides fascians A25f]|uniref:DedA family protein n=1 Tax=Rhodococcoides fascians TaxID=1828 RepID=UPI0006925B3B|nr:hypothetical protein [Rhodococcus fascians]QII09252.1 hypothetical protein BH93_27145 [Rhodococcus fascians A25f]